MIEKFECGCIIDFNEDRAEGKAIKLCKKDKKRREEKRRGGKGK